MAVKGWVRTTRHGLDDWRGLRELGSWRRHEGEGKKRRGKVGLKWMWMLLSPNKVFRLEPRPCQMTSSPAVVPGDCLSVYTVYTTYVSVWGPKKTVDKKRTTQHEAWGGGWFYMNWSFHDNNSFTHYSLKLSLCASLHRKEDKWDIHLELPSELTANAH